MTRTFLMKAGIVAAAGGALSALLLACTPAGVDVAAPATGPIPIAISSELPTELNQSGGGAQSATLEQAAAFAWQEFIALNWPARNQTGRVGDRDSPGNDCLFGGFPDPNAGTPAPDCADRPLTWETFRGKAEIFSAAGSSQPYDSLPDYSNLYTSPVGPCSGFTPAGTPWVNLDETTEIGLTAMYAGAGISTPSAANAAPQLIRFLAKANRAEFDYVNAIGAAQGIPSALRTATINFAEAFGSPPAGGTSFVSLPNNTIEIKAGWRQLNPQTEDVSRFHTTLVRHYEPTGPTSQCYRDDVWGLVSLHIIQKTASAPHFIYATFEQADNIRTASGQTVEDVDGNVIATQPCRSDQTAPCTRTPTVVYQDNPNPNTPPSITLPTPQTAYCTANTSILPPNQLYYLNSASSTGVPIGGFICMNSRDHPIPPTIIAANQNAHAAIAAYNSANGIQNSPWSYYKLINVQFMPMTLPPPGQNPPNTLPLYSGPDAATFYQSNSVVESNFTLQNFSGHLAGSSGTKTDWASQASPPGPAGQLAYALYYRPAGSTNANGYDMGGCMGCHGTAQRFGGDFSFILLGGAVTAPERIPSIVRNGGARIDPARALVRWTRQE